MPRGDNVTRGAQPRGEEGRCDAEAARTRLVQRD